MNDKTIIAVAAIISLTILESINLVTRGINGTLFGIVVAAIAGLGGYILKSIVIKINGDK